MRYTRLKALALALAVTGLSCLGARAAGEVFTGADVGAPAMPGSFTVSGTQITVKGGGADIWGTADQFYYYYTVKDGGFDVIVRVVDLQGPDNWTKMEIMAREAQDDGAGNLVPAAGDRHVSLMTTRAAGQNQIGLQCRLSGPGGDSTNPGNTATPAYPNTWLRLTRSGAVISLFNGTDGVTWNALGSVDTSTTAGGAFADKLLLGFAVTSHNNTATDANVATAVLDNIQFLVAPPEVVSSTPANHASYVSPSTTYSFNVKSVPGVENSNVVFKVNGVDKSSSLTFSGTPTALTATYAGPFVENQVYNIQINLKDVNDLTSTANLSFNTFKQDNFSIEAEDFNFNSGHYVDNPPLGSLSPYAPAIGTPNIDEYRPDTGGNHDYRVFIDPNTFETVQDVVGVRTRPSNETLRQAYVDAQVVDPSAEDFIVGWLANTEWLNYTRTFPAGTYQMYARIAHGDGNGSVNRMDWVTSGATTANQTTAPMGVIQGTTTGSYDVFTFTPLTDAVGNKLVQRIAAGVKTMRYTKLSGGCDLNFFSFVPVADPGTLAPFLSAIYPTQNLTGVSPLADITASITDRDTKVNSASVQMILDGTNDVTAKLTKATVASGLNITYSSTNIYPASSVHTVTLIYADNAATPNVFTNTWQFTTTGAYSILPAADALAANSGDTSGFMTRLVQTSTGSAHTLAWTEATLMGSNPVILSSSDSTSTLINYNGNGSSANFGNDTLFSTAFGLPSTFDASAANFATETVTYLALQRGFYRFGVNSDDDFWVTEGSLPGNSGRVGGIALGQYDNTGGRGVADTTFDFVAPVDGLYPFRLLFEQGGGGFGFEWFSVNPATGVRTLINDPNTAGSIKAYRYSSALPANVVTIAVNPPATLPLIENTPMTITAAGMATINGNVITNSLLFTYKWTVDGQPIIDTEIQGQSSATLYLPLAKTYNSGVYQCVVSMPGYKPVTSTPCAVTIAADTLAPSVTSIHGSGGLNSIIVSFSEPIDSSTLIPSSFSVDGGVTVTGVTFETDPTTGNVFAATLTTTAQTEGKFYTVTINNVGDFAGNKMSNVKATFNAYITDPTVKMLCEFYDNIGSIAALQTSAKFLAGTPDRVVAAPDFQTPSWENGSTYGGRLAAVVTAPVTGDYVFHLATDDLGQLYVSQDETPGNWFLAADDTTTYVASVTSWTNQREWANASSIPSRPIRLTAGNKYYIEALWNEGSGGDGCAVGWAIPGNTNIVVIPGSALGAQKVDISNAKIKIGTQPVGLTVAENSPASFSVVVTNAVSQFSTNETVTYQWQKNGANVAANGNGATYSIVAAPFADNGATFQCVMHIPGLSVTSAPVVMTVTQDTTAPVAVSAGTLSAAPTTVGVLFSEFVDAASATTIANYTVSGATVTSVTLLPSGKAVALALNAAVVSGATVKVENVKDIAATPNTVASTTLTISFSDLTSKDVGTVNATNSALFSDPIYVGSTVALGGGAFEVKAGGSDIWNNADGFHFTYKEVTGDFEVKVRVESLQYVTDNWAKAGLMIRESLAGGSRNVNTVVDPTAGANVWEPNYRIATDGATAEIAGQIPRVSPVTYPNAWIKLTRADQVFTSFKSTNGLDWITLATYTNTVSTNPYPAKMLVGMCATAHNNSGTNTVVEFRDYELTTGGTVEAPTITVSRVKPNLVLTWDATMGAGFQLYSAPTIMGAWAVEGTAPVTANGVVTVTLPTTDASKFFQLKK